MYPERLDGGEDFLLVASEGHAHSEQVSTETDGESQERDKYIPWSLAQVTISDVCEGAPAFWQHNNGGLQQLVKIFKALTTKYTWIHRQILMTSVSGYKMPQWADMCRYLVEEPSVYITNSEH